MENLAQLLGAGYRGEDHTLRDSQLMEEVCTECICDTLPSFGAVVKFVKFVNLQASALRSKFSEKVEGQVKAAAEGLFLCKENIDHAEREVSSKLV